MEDRGAQMANAFRRTSRDTTPCSIRVRATNARVTASAFLEADEGPTRRACL